MSKWKVVALAAAMELCGCEQQLPTKSLYQHLMAVEVKWEREDEVCRTGAGDAPDTLAACARRDGLTRELGEIGYCRYDNPAMPDHALWLNC